MTWADFAIIFGCCLATMLLCRVVPLFALKGRKLPASVVRALGFIPPAAFAALVANDLLKPGMFDAAIWPACAPLLASAVVAAIALKTRSLLWCALSGVAVYALLTII